MEQSSIAYLSNCNKGVFLLFNNNKNEQYLLNPSNDFKKEIMIFSIFLGEKNF
jgi:hypothetical protein